ncbi:hypothetical protein ILUMI_04355 [Ignelater luminosus]|uniref:Uncharacterized protein n=1 Tax=Ignelater luminosus TaxID=2038154 RepID=A0A8K0DEM0_IGNLU|nr:hypothetical protein ILUMI_04355 [Ignelater luminosus]
MPKVKDKQKYERKYDEDTLHMVLSDISDGMSKKRLLWCMAFLEKYCKGKQIDETDTSKIIIEVVDDFIREDEINKMPIIFDCNEPSASISAVTCNKGRDETNNAIPLSPELSTSAEQSHAALNCSRDFTTIDSIQSSLSNTDLEKNGVQLKQYQMWPKTPERKGKRQNEKLPKDSHARNLRLEEKNVTQISLQNVEGFGVGSNKTERELKECDKENETEGILKECENHIAVYGNRGPPRNIIKNKDRTGLSSWSGSLEFADRKDLPKKIGTSILYECKAALIQRLMVWVVIAYRSKSPLIFLEDYMDSQATSAVP